MEDRMETVRGLAGKIKEKYWPPGKDQLLILVLVGLLLAVIAIPVEKKGTADEISREREMNSGMMGNPSGSGNSSVDDNLERMSHCRIWKNMKLRRSRSWKNFCPR